MTVNISLVKEKLEIVKVTVDNFHTAYDACHCDETWMWVTCGPGPFGHAEQRENAILKFSLVDMVSEVTL